MGDRIDQVRQGRAALDLTSRIQVPDEHDMASQRSRCVLQFSDSLTRFDLPLNALKHGDGIDDDQRIVARPHRVEQGVEVGAIEDMDL